VAHAEPIKVAYDAVANHKVDFNRAKSWLEEALIRDYSVTPEELRANDADILKWATWPGHCCSRAADEFTGRHP
jgi:hypothetical protein